MSPFPGRWETIRECADYYDATCTAHAERLTVGRMNIAAK
jgi:hypothetical protein